MAQIAIIGAGPAGCAAAVELCERGHQVTLIESGRSAGGNVRWPLAGDPTRPAYVGGVGIGGSSSINGAVLGAQSDGAPPRLPSFVASPGEVGSALLRAGSGTRLRVLGRDPERISVADALGIAERATGIAERATGIAERATGIAERATRIAERATGFAERATSGLVVQADCRADTLVVDGGSVVGVTTTAGEMAADAVLVAAGPIGTAILLGDSGIGGASVGLGLRDHRCLTVVFDGAGARPVPDVRASASAVVDVDDGFLIGIDHFGAGSDLGGVLVVCESPSRGGRVHRSSVTGAVSVDLGPLDIPAMACVWEAARPVLDRMAAAWDGDVVVDEWGTPLKRLGTDAASVDAWIRRSVGGLFHAAGTCRSAVDDRGRIAGLAGIFVAGASILAEPPRWPMGACVISGQAAARAVDDDITGRSSLADAVD